MTINDAAGDRYKKIELETRTTLTGGIIVVRIDGKGFSKLTKKEFTKPFDGSFTEAMTETARQLCASDAPALVAYTQSDEISVVMTPGQDWFGNQVQKITSVIASMTTAFFNNQVDLKHNPAFFDARAFVLRDEADVDDYLAWRRADAARNSISMLAHHHYGSSGIKGVGTNELRRRLGGKWEQLPDSQRFGTLVVPTKQKGIAEFQDGRDGKIKRIECERRTWMPRPFTEDFSISSIEK